MIYAHAHTITQTFIIDIYTYMFTHMDIHTVLIYRGSTPRWKVRMLK